MYDLFFFSSCINIYQDAWQGIAFDILHALRDEVHFSYDVITSNGFGGFNESSGLWSGMIGDIVQGRADVAVQGISWTTTRSEVGRGFFKSFK